MNVARLEGATKGSGIAFIAETRSARRKRFHRRDAEALRKTGKNVRVNAAAFG
jgi:hypothetical protein